MRLEHARRHEEHPALHRALRSRPRNTSLDARRGVPDFDACRALEMPALRLASRRAHVQSAGTFRRQASVRPEHYLIIAGERAARAPLAIRSASRPRWLGPRKSRRVLIPNVRYRPIAVIQKSMSWTRSFTGTMIGGNRSGIDHGRRGLASKLRSRPIRGDVSR